MLASQDIETLLRRIVGLLVPALGDWCVVNLVGLDGGMIRVTDAREMPAEKQAALNEIRSSFPLHPDAPFGLSYAIRTGKAQLMHGLSEEHFRQVSDDARYLELWKIVGVVSFVAVPIKVGTRIYGGLGLDSVTPHRLFEKSDLKFLQEIAGLIGLALERAFLIKEASDANRQRDEFLTMLSHELRTPLSAIIGWSQLLSRKMNDANFDIKQAATIIERNARLQKDLVDNIIDLSLVATERMYITWEGLDLMDCVLAVVESTQPLAHAKSLSLNFVTQESVAFIMGDSRRMQQVFLHLLSNAIKFTPAGGRVLVSLKRQGTDFVVSVCDTGVGIDSEFLPRIFNRFTQADSSMRRSRGGLGLGLALVRHIVSLHGGTVKALSEGHGEGTQVLVSLPMKPPRL